MMIDISSKPTPNPPNPPRKLNILLHDSHTLRMDSTEIGILKKMHQESLRSFLQRLDRMRLPAQLRAHISGQQVQRDLAHQPRER